MEQKMHRENFQPLIPWPTEFMLFLNRPKPMTPKLATAISPQNDTEANYVQTTYNSIATHFSQTRHSQWPKIQSFIAKLPSFALVHDAGSGNGKNGCGYFCVSSDSSINLLTCLNNRTHNQILPLNTTFSPRFNDPICASIHNLPFRPMFDAALCIAVLHHLSSHQRRIESLRSLANSLVSGGRLLVLVWALEQTRKFDSQDVLVPWTCGDVVHQRYYHLFKSGELEAVVVEAGGMRILDSGYDRDNWWVECERI